MSAMAAPRRFDLAARLALRRDPFVWILALFVLALFVGSWWGLPCTDSWSNDEVSPRPSALGAVFETWIPGHYFRYPPLHVLGLTVLQSPIILAGVARAGLDQDAIARELIQPAYMTPAAVLGRLVAAAMALAIIWNQKRLWERIASPRAGLVAAALTACNPIFVYLAHTAGLDVPYFCWVSFALVEIERVLAGEGSERRVALLVAAALLTKDQSLFILAGPLLLAFVLRPLRDAPAGARLRALWQPRLLRAGLPALALCLVVAGVVTNPTGFRRKLEFMRWGNREWVAYERSLRGLLEQLADIARSVPLFGTRVAAVAALAGLAVAARSGDRLRRLLPAAAALSYFVLFVIPSRWTMERHLMPLALLLLPYAALLLDRIRSERLALGIALAALVPQMVDVASVDATLVVDPRAEATRFLSALPRGARVEVYGGNQYLPVLPSHLALTRVGTEDFASRSPLPGVVERREAFGLIASRDPEYLVVSESTVGFHAPPPGARLSGQGRLDAADSDGRAFFAALAADTSPYRRVLRARCVLPWPLQCRRVHLSTGAEAWIYRAPSTR